MKHLVLKQLPTMPSSSAPEWQDPKDDKILTKLLPSVLPASSFCFCVISKNRPENVAIVNELLGEDKKDKEDVVWIVGEGAAERDAYRAHGAENVISGGGLCKSRNAALDYAKQRRKYCVQLSDDIHGFTFMHQKCEWHKEPGFSGWTPLPLLLWVLNTSQYVGR